MEEFKPLPAWKRRLAEAFGSVVVGLAIVGTVAIVVVFMYASANSGTSDTPPMHCYYENGQSWC